MLGQDSLTGRDLSEFTHPDDRRGQTESGMSRALAGELGVVHNVRRMIRGDGSEMWADLTTSGVEDGDGNFMFAIRMMLDVTEHMQIDRLKDEFLGIVSHELRTPLTSIRAAVGLLATGALGTFPPEAVSTLDIAASNTERLVKLVNDILDLERLEAGKAELNVSSADIRDIVRQAVETVQPIAAQDGISIDTAVPPILLDADAKLAGQTLTNLLSNAVKCSPPGATVSVSAIRDDGSVTLTVVDQGRGIPSDQIDKIFDKFQQVDSSDSRVHGGSGLGLAIARNIVTQHGGSIWVESNEGGGATFKVRLPVSQPGAGFHEARPGAAPR
jgi:signal transduction histidine kinase